ncbi:MAG: stress protein [Desulfobacteraceae bacterium IS3]|nr:MAG: stress protein [Desulfobacteraceae bacterium IS3]
MGIILQKGQRISLSKESAALSKIMAGLGWDPVKGGSAQIDCDTSVLMLNAADKLDSIKDVIYFGNLSSKCGSVVHKGDNTTGKGEGDDEQAVVDLPRVPQGIRKLVFIANIYKCAERKQHFGMIQSAFIRIVNLADNKEMARFDLTETYSGFTSLIVGEIYRHNEEWKFAAVGQGSNAVSLEEIVKSYR